MTKSVEAIVRGSLSLTRIQPQSLIGWTDDQGHAALVAFQRQALEIQRKGSGFSRPVLFGGRHEDWLQVITAAGSASDPQRFWIENFICFSVSDAGQSEGLFTGYYEPEVFGSRTPHPDFPVPIYAKPSDLVAFTPDEIEITGLHFGRRVNNHPEPYDDRATIENGALQGKGLEICWLKNWVDAFFIHIQGSGRVRFSDQTEMRLAFAAKSGLPYTSIGAVLLERGLLSKEAISMQSLKTWMAVNPHAARELMWQNRSFIFFREAPILDPNLGSIGAAQVPLTPLRSLAIDRDIWMFGTPFWLDALLPPEAKAPPLRQIMIAQDTGSAIKGAIRGDVYWGHGETAELIAGHMKSKGTFHVFLPHQVVDRLRLAQ